MTFCHHLLLVIPFAPRSPIRSSFSPSLLVFQFVILVIPFVTCYPLCYLLSPLLILCHSLSPSLFVIPFVHRYPLRYLLSPSLLVVAFGTRYPLRYSLSLSVLVIPFATRFPLRYWLSPFATRFPLRYWLSPSLLVFPFATRFPLRYSLSPPLLVDTICLFFLTLVGHSIKRNCSRIWQVKESCKSAIPQIADKILLFFDFHRRPLKIPASSSLVYSYRVPFFICRHLGAVNQIAFVDQNRKFVSTSDDKSVRVWEW